MATINTQVSQKVMPDGSIRWVVTIGSKTSEFALIGAGPLVLGGATVTIPGGKAIAGISGTGLITYTDNSTPTQLVLTPGKSAKQVLIDANLLPANATDAAYAAYLKGAAGLSAKAVLIAANFLPANASDAAFAAFIKGGKGDPGQDSTVPGPQGKPGKPGVLATGTGLNVGHVYYRADNFAAWVLFKPYSQERAEGLVGMCDQDGDMIAPGNVVNVAGSGFVAGTDYIVEVADAQGRPWAPLVLPLASGVQPSATRAYLYIGRAFDAGDGLKMRFDWEYLIADGAKASSSVVIDPRDYAFNQQLGANLVYLLDSQNNQAANYGQALNRILADSDTDGGSGFMASPVVQNAAGTSRGIYLHDMGYGGVHLRSPARWPTAQVGGDFLMVFQSGASSNALGFFWGWTGAEFSAMRLGGSPDYTTFEKWTVNGLATTSAALGGTANSGFANGSIGNKVLGCCRLNVNGTAVKVKTWKYDTTKGVNPQGLARQGESEPAAWDYTGTLTTAPVAGRCGYIFTQDHIRIPYMAMSPDPAIPATFQGA